MPGDTEDDGVKAIGTVMAALKPLNEATRENVLRFVLNQLKIELAGATDSPFRPVTEAGIQEAKVYGLPSEKPPVQLSEMDIRSLAHKKKPKTVNEKVAVVAYYLKNLAPADERRDFISTEDITNYFPQADFELPTAPGMALTHAKNAGYLNALGSGQYRLNPVGHNLVSHKLPQDQTASKPRKRKTTNKKRR